MSLLALSFPCESFNSFINLPKSFTLTPALSSASTKLPSSNHWFKSKNLLPPLLLKAFSYADWNFSNDCSCWSVPASSQNQFLSWLTSAFNLSITSLAFLTLSVY